jgi:cation diffusion facilitator CzcD-associated flavoprotein CzcO
MTQGSETLIVGGGQAGLAVAGSLARRRRPSVVIDRGQRVGDSWRLRYDALRLNSAAGFSSLPGFRIGRRHGIFPSAREWGDYLERYVARLRLDVRCGTTAHRVEQRDGAWHVDTSVGEFRAEYLVIATGMDHAPVMPDWPGHAHFEGPLIHAADFRNPEPFRGQDVLVVGCGNTGSELAHLLAHDGAARVRVSVRTPPNIMPRRWLGIPLYPGTMLLDRLPERLADGFGRLGQRLIVGDLSEYGLPLPDKGMKASLKDGTPPTVEDGFVESVKSGAIEIVAAVSAFDGRHVVLADGSRIAPDAVIAATGYARNVDHLVADLVSLDDLGSPVVNRDYEAVGAQRLHFVGYWASLSGPLYAMRRQAERVARAIAVRTPGRRPWGPGDRSGP